MKKIGFIAALLCVHNASAENVSLERDLKKLLPSEKISVRHVNSNVALHGNVSTPEVAKKALEIASQYVDGDHEVINMLKLENGQQVLLKVKFGELSRKSYNNLTNTCGVNSAKLTACINDLSLKGAFKTYSEPSLVAASGETAYFATGGEVAVPHFDSENKKIVSYKPYGVKLSFTPKIVAHNNIRVAVDYEISNKVKSGLSSFPEFATSHATTTVELAPGESFMIAGLLNDESHKSVDNKGALGFISGLFPSSSYEQKEIVISITPYLVNPMTNEEVKLPTDDTDVDTELNKILKGKLKSSNSTFIVE
ncbi:MAG: BON domain-containing protein [Alphaproteobacteria bacterium]|nr:BON domain-containing protein [Alphaproteobacteria bacterium]OJV17257.1 MAG: hypothetical protein BGO27_06260 [Alphaproteobacteria bacterium 33-17]